MDTQPPSWHGPAPDLLANFGWRLSSRVGLHLSMDTKQKLYMVTYCVLNICARQIVQAFYFSQLYISQSSVSSHYMQQPGIVGQLLVGNR